jgi:hypothetical protein
MRRLTRIAPLAALVLIAAAACDQSSTAPAAPTPAPAAASGNCWGRPAGTSVRTLASKQAYWTYEQNWCTGYPAYVYLYQFRSTDQWICYVDIGDYYAYSEFDDAECEWYAG